MNILIDIIIICIIIFFVYLGAKKGFAKTLVEVFGYVLTIMIAFSVADYTANMVYEKNIKASIVNSVKETVKDNDAADTVKDSVNVIWDSIPPYIAAFKGVTGLDKSSISDYLKSYNKKADEKQEHIAAAVADNVVKPITVSVIKFVITVLLIIILFFVVKLLANFIGKIFNKSLFGGLNHFLGGVAGVVKGMLVALVLVGLINILLPMFDNEIFYINQESINNSYIFKIFYNVCNSF